MPCVSQVLGIHQVQQICCAERLSLKVLPRRLPWPAEWLSRDLPGQQGPETIFQQLSFLAHVQKSLCRFPQLFFTIFLRDHSQPTMHVPTSGRLHWATPAQHGAWSTPAQRGAWGALQNPSRPSNVNQTQQKKKKRKNIINRSQSRTISIPYLPYFTYNGESIRSLENLLHPQLSTSNSSPGQRTKSKSRHGKMEPGTAVCSLPVMQRSFP